MLPRRARLMIACTSRGSDARSDLSCNNPRRAMRRGERYRATISRAAGSTWFAMSKSGSSARPSPSSVTKTFTNSATSDGSTSRFSRTIAAIDVSMAVTSSCPSGTPWKRSRNSHASCVRCSMSASPCADQSMSTSTIASSSASTTPARRSTNCSRRSSESRPTMPKSSSPMRPPGRNITLPGCGSAW